MRPELCYCAVCGGVILPIDDATCAAGEWTCAICTNDDREPRGLNAIIEEMADAVAFERGTAKQTPDWRDEYDGGAR